MEKEKLIHEINRTLETLKMYADRLEKNAGKVHRMDIELMIEKTREIYDRLIQLDTLIIPFETEIPKTVVAETEKQEEKIEPEPEVVVKPATEEIPEPETKETYEKPVITEKEPEEQQEIQHMEEEPAEPVEIPEEKEVVSHKEVREEPEMPDAQQDYTETEEDSKSTIDLFSSAEPTISDVYSEQETVTVADKFNQETVNELREAIGINEKFLFINELFNGDMSKYNKAIDELDEMATYKGAETYLLELKVQHQWEEDSQALMKLTELVKRKFGM
jgi:hypothetical protein